MEVLKMKFQRGFTLAEMAIVVLLISIAMTMGLKMVTAKLENAAYSETKSKQEQIKIALIGFMRSNGRLPCPDTASPPAGNESAPCTTPASSRGVVPWVTLGLAKDTALDGWKNFFTYQASNNNSATSPPGAEPVPRARLGNQDWTLKTAGFDIGSLSSMTTNGVASIEISDGNSVPRPAPAIAYNVVAVIYSHGKNGLGATTVRGTTNTSPAPADDEGINNAYTTSGLSQFIIRDITDSVTNGAYDDLVVYLTPQDLLQPLMSDGTLKSCYAYCPATVTPTCTIGGTFSCVGGGAGYCTGSAPACTLGGVPTCSAGTPQCAPPGTGCSASGIPIGNSTATCP